MHDGGQVKGLWQNPVIAVRMHVGDGGSFGNRLGRENKTGQNLFSFSKWFLVSSSGTSCLLSFIFVAGYQSSSDNIRFIVRAGQGTGSPG